MLEGFRSLWVLCPDEAFQEFEFVFFTTLGFVPFNANWLGCGSTGWGYFGHLAFWERR
jgi:hypothetical protein